MRRGKRTRRAPRVSSAMDPHQGRPSVKWEREMAEMAIPGGVSAVRPSEANSAAGVVLEMVEVTEAADSAVEERVGKVDEVSVGTEGAVERTEASGGVDGVLSARIGSEGVAVGAEDTTSASTAKTYS